jgi:hypothetical protein
LRQFFKHATDLFGHMLNRLVHLCLRLIKADFF